MSSTDETARVILGSSPPTRKPSDGTRFGDALAKVLQNYHGDLQRLAKLWLLKDEIAEAIEQYVYHLKEMPHKCAESDSTLRVADGREREAAGKIIG